MLANTDIALGSSVPASTARKGIQTTPGPSGGNGGQATHGDVGGQLLRLKDLDASMVDLVVPDIVLANHHRLQGARQGVLCPGPSMLNRPILYRRRCTHVYTRS